MTRYLPIGVFSGLLGIIFVLPNLGAAQLLRPGSRNQHWIYPYASQPGAQDNHNVALGYALPLRPIRGPHTGGLAAGKAGSTATGEGFALIEVEVPARAELWIEGERSNQEGTGRFFIPPPLKKGETYPCEIRVRWIENGKPIEQRLTVPLHADEKIRLRFPTAS